MELGAAPPGSGMPGSHSALIASVAHAVGLFVGFDTPLEALVARCSGLE